MKREAGNVGRQVESASLTQRQRVRMRVLFWVLYFLGPLTAAVEHLTTGTIVAALPPSLRPLIRTMTESFAIWAPVIGGAMGAAYCLARLCGRRFAEEVAAFTILIGIVLAMSYFLLLFAGCLVVWLVSALWSFRP